MTAWTLAGQHKNPLPPVRTGDDTVFRTTHYVVLFLEIAMTSEQAASNLRAEAKRLSDAAHITSQNEATARHVAQVNADNARHAAQQNANHVSWLNQQKK